MATDEVSPRAIIEQAMARQPDTVVDISIELLEVLANSLISMIGEQGFETLLYRAAHRVSLDFPWLVFDPRARPADPEFHLLRRCFEGQVLAQARAAISLLFNTLIDILATLIGTHMTTLILQSATGRVGATKMSKEQDNG